MTAPISKGDVLGTVAFETVYGDILTGSLVASRSVEMKEPTMDEVLDEWISSSAPWMFKLMPRHNPSVRIFYWLIAAGLIVLIVWRVRVKRRRERERMEKIRREMLRKKKIAMQRAAQMKREKREGSVPARTQTANVRRPAPKTDAAPIRRVRK